MMTSTFTTHHRARRLGRLFGLLSALMPATVAHAGDLQVERLDLGDTVPGVQAYNLQETRELRVFALSQAGFKRSRIVVQRRQGGQWAQPETLPFADPRWRDSDPHLSADGMLLTFVSDRPEQGDAPLGQLDLFESRFEGGRWGAPRRLAEALQSPGYELGPERHGEHLYFASYRSGGPGKLSVYSGRPGGVNEAPQPLPAPVNLGDHNSDFSLSPDGRYAIWWSNRDAPGGKGGDLYLTERVGAGFGPALRLPEPVNGPAFEFTPSVSADGRWLYFASTRDDAAGLSHMYRVSWPSVIAALGTHAEAHSQAMLDERVSTLWRAISHGANEGSDGRLLKGLLHPQARIFGQTLKDGALGVRHWSVDEFLAVMQASSPRAIHECEVRREHSRYGAHAQVYSVVETHRDAARSQAEYTGVNSMQWQLGPDGWQLLSLHYALTLPGQAPPAADSPRRCMG